jgi:SAM-dependent methyltransferase
LFNKNTDFDVINRISRGFVLSRILQVATKLGIFDTINKGRLSSVNIAKILKLNPRATETFLNSLVAMRLLSKEDREYINTELSSKYLLKNSPCYFGGMLLFEHHQWDTWGNLEESLKTGKPSRTPDMFQGHEAETERFIMAMHSLVRARGDANIIIDRLDLSRAKSMIDIGSGPGSYPIAFIKKYPSLKVTIFDLPGTIKVTKRVLEAEGMLGRIELFEGDYNRGDLPKGFDIAFLSNIIHSEDEETNQRLMKHIYKILNPGGEIIIKDHIMNEDLISPACGAIFSINMLLSTRGRDYSFKEVASWLKDANFIRIKWKKLPKPLNSSLVLALKRT